MLKLLPAGVFNDVPNSSRSRMCAVQQYKYAQLLFFCSRRLVARAAAARQDLWSAAIKQKTEKETKILLTLQFKAAARELLASRTYGSSPPTPINPTNCL
jgi:hypothetical protein